MSFLGKSIGRKLASLATGVCLSLVAASAQATNFTMTVPGVGIPLPSAYPEAGGVAIVMVGDNGNIYYQFSDPDGAFRGFQSNGQPAAFRGNPFTINDPIPLDCGVASCTSYFGGGIATMYIRFSAYDGDTQPGGFDEDDIELVMNGVDVGNWSDVQTELTNNSGTTSYGFETGFGNGGFNTGWFTTTNQTLLDNVLSSGVTTTQVRDDDPNDNYWDFRRGDSLDEEALRTIAPGYEFEKTASTATFAAVGEMVTYTYTVTNIGSVNINNLVVTDDKISSITCDKSTINETTGGGPVEVATCTGTYEITQEDFDAQEVTNIAQATGDPEYGVLGAVQDSVTVTGPAVLAPAIEVVKSASPSSFSAAGQTITYSYVINNVGDTTLTDIALTDDKISGTICTVASLVPQAPNDTATCTATYVTTQDDVDAFATSGTQLTNVATVTAQDPSGGAVTDTDNEMIDGPVAAPAMTVLKTALQPNFDEVDDLIQFEIEIENTGNVTWPAAPTITDTLVTDDGGSVTCPTGTVAPGATIVCQASYTADQDDLNEGEVENIADASITVGTATATGQGSVTVPAITSTGLDIVKQLPSGAETTFDAVGDQIAYEYVLTNSGTVTLFNPAVTDDKVAVTCTETEILPGTSITCTSTAPHDVVQADLDAGIVTNTASATSQTLSGATVDSVETSLSVNADQQPAMTLDKQAPTVLPADFIPGLIVTYTYEVTNTGNVTITDQIEITDDKFPTAFACGSGDLPPQPDPASTRTCTADYTVTAADVLSGSVTNRATASDGTTTTTEDTATIPQQGTPALGLTKASDPVAATFSSLTDTVDYTFTVTNTGDTTIIAAQPISVSDPKIGTVDCSAQPATLAPGQSFDCTGTYSAITQAEIDAGEIINTASASFTGPDGVVTSPTATETVVSDVTPSMTLDKQAPATFGAVGSTVTYTFELTNGSAQTISSASITDPLIPTLNCDFTDIAPFATVSCTGDYTVTQPDLDAGFIDNEATATGTAPTGESLSATDSETTPADPGALIRALSLDKTADIPAFAAVGDVIDYTFAVTNTGTLTLSNVTVSDPAVGLNCTIPEIAPLDTNDTHCAASHTVTQADIDLGYFDNTATASATGATPSDSTASTPGPARDAAFTIAKDASDTTDVQVGQVITYTHVVTNTGNVTLTNITLTDSHTSASGTVDLTFSPSNVIASLAPGDSETVTTIYTVTQEDIDLGADLTNTVTGTATPPTGVTAPTASDDETVDVVDAAPAISVVKTEQDATTDFAALPTSETFTFAVTNDGNVTLAGFVLTDDLTGFSCVLPDLLPGQTATACANSDPLETTHVITQADIDRGSLLNTVEVSDGTLTAQDSVTLAGPTQAPAISMVKSETGGAGFSAIGDEITYEYVITNDGNITLTGPFSVVDDKTTVDCPVTPVAGIAPGLTITCTATYTVDQDDLDAGQVTNLATASITQNVVPGGPTVISSAQASETVPAAQDPELEIAKGITPGTPTTFQNIGDTISYDYTITNSGNVSIPAPITVDDDQIGSGLTCATAELAPGDSVTCTHVWTADQPEIDAGSVTNVAAPVALFNGNPVPANTDTVTALAIQTPEMTMLKELVGIEADSFAAGKTVTYSYTVTNTGNTTLLTEPTITDNVITTAADITIDAPFPAAGLAPGDSITYTGEYVLTLTDIQLGSVTNTATAESDGVVSNPSSVTTPENTNPALEVVKSADVATFAAVGDAIEYTYAVTNKSTGSPAPAFGNVITVTDDKISGPISCDPTLDNQLEVDETTTCTATYLVTQADLDAGEVTNSAVAETVFAGQDVFSPADVVTVTGEELPALSTLKEVIAGPDPAGEGDTLTFRITATNSGNQTLSNVQIADPMLPTLTCTVSGVAAPAIVTLAPGEALICEGDYTLTQDDVDAQALTNTATASGSNPQGVDVDADGTTTHPVEASDPSVVVEKAFVGGEPGSAYSTVGEELTFAITVRNTGNVTLASTTVTDSIVAGTCNVPELAPGEEDSSCTFVYTVTQTDIDNGTIQNTATAVSQPAVVGSDPVEGEDTLELTGPDAEPSFALNKTADLTSFDSDNVTITYTYIVANTGNITLTAAPTVTDDKIASVTCDPFPAGGLLPLEFIECTGTYVTSQEDVDAGGVTNIASVSSTEAPFDPNNPGNAGATETVDSVRTPGVSITKEANDPDEVIAGQTITYTYTVENTGNVTLQDIALSDQHTSATGTAALTIANGGMIDELAPGATATLTGTYLVTQEDIDAGNDLTNVVSLTSTSPDGTTPVAEANETVTVAPDVPSIEAIKTVQGTPGTALGDTVVFEITVENTGNVTLGGITLADTLRRQDGTDILPAPTPVLTDGSGSIAPGEVWTYEVSHVLTQDDIDAGGLSNSVTATGTAPDGEDVSDVSDTGSGSGSTPTPFAIPADPSLETLKTVSVLNTGVDETVTFEITVENTGNVTLTGVAVSDDTLTRADGTVLALTTAPTWSGSDGGSAEGTLKVGETATYTATYVLTQEDVDAGGIENTATATGTPPIGSPVTDDVDTPAQVEIEAEPAITLSKDLGTGGPTFDTVGQVLGYEFTVENTGNVTITDAITIVDPLITDAGGTIDCPAPPYAPGDIVVCTGSYAVTQDDIDAGEVLNSATASVPGADPVTDDETVPAQQLPAMEVLKEAEELASSEFVVGRAVSYTYTVTNTGNVTLTDPISVSDNLIASVVCDDLPADGLLPDGTLTCTGSYTVTADDVRLASVTNLAGATDGTTTSPTTSEIIPVDGVPALTIEKALISVTDSADAPRAGEAFAEVGDKLTYQFTVTNSGEVSFANQIDIYDDHFGAPIACYVPEAGNLDLVPTEQATCEATYVITQEDLDAGMVLNEAYAQTEFGNGPTTVTSPPDTVETLADGAPAIEVVKDVDIAQFAAVGDILTYTFTVTNAGNQTLSSIEVTDPLIPGLDCTVVSLAPGDDTSCEGTLEITQAHMDAGEVVNQASVDALSPSGDAVEDDSNEVTSIVPDGASVLSLVKTATPDPFGGVGSTIVYGFAVTNDGPFTLVDLEVTDPLVPGYTCSIATLAPGETNSASCSMPYTVTQDDVDAGEITNEASVTGETPFGRPSEATGDVTTPGPDAAPALVVVKTADVPATTLGSVVTFTVTVENTGNVTLEAPVLDDDMERIATGRPTFLTTPFVYASGDDGDDLLDVGEVWEYTATYEITQSDINAGGVQNSVTATAQDQLGNEASDVSDDGVDSNGDDNPTLVEITQSPVLDVVKTITTSGAVAGDVVVFRIEAANRGNVDIENITIDDTLTRRDGTDISADASAPARVAPGAADTVLSPGSLWAWEVTYELTQDDVDAGGISNLATASGVGPLGGTVTDQSKDGDEGDGNPATDPTELVIVAEPGIEVTKLHTAGAPLAAGESVTFEVTAQNTGTVTLSGVTMADTLTNLDGTSLVADSILPDPTAGVTLAPDETITWVVVYTLTQDDVDAGGVQNSATATGNTPSGLPVSDLSDNGVDGDGNTLDDPTVVAVPADTTLVVEKVATIPERIAGTVFATTFTITIENAGNVTQRDISLIDDMTVFVAPATLVDVATPVLSGFESGSANSAYNGVDVTEALGAGTSLIPGQTGTVEITVQYDIADGSPGADNTAYVRTDRVASAVQAATSVAIAEPEPDILAGKSIVTPGPYQAGSVVEYELTFTNRNTTTEAGLTLVDRLPAGMTYVDGSALYNGSATPAPTLQGRQIRWDGVDIAPGGTVTITLSTLLTQSAGSFTNTAYVLDRTGAQVSNVAAATIDIAPEPVFDCSDIIGKVFDDVNQNGYQDPPPDGRAAITDQDYYSDGKFEVAPEVIEQQQQGEPGLAGVKLVTVRGDIITTDEYGRYSVPCALLPGPTGGNFTLKLDERSLPTGYRVTTENPRTMRLTAGIMTEMNFGASLANLVDIDLLAVAFEGTQPSAALANGVDGLVAQIARTPSVLRITYYTNGEGNDLARARLAALEDLIRDRWRGSYRLRIETTIARVQ